MSTANELLTVDGADIGNLSVMGETPTPVTDLMLEIYKLYNYVKNSNIVRVFCVAD